MKAPMLRSVDEQEVSCVRRLQWVYLAHPRKNCCNVVNLPRIDGAAISD